MIKGANLYVSGIPKNWTQPDLENLFTPYGNIITSRILCDLQTGTQFLLSSMCSILLSVVHLSF